MSKFPALTSLVVIAAATAVAAGWPSLRAAGRMEARNLMGEAASANLAEASADYQLASRLDPNNQAAFLGVARTQIATGHAEAALTALKSAGQGSDAAQLGLRTLIELGRTTEATNAAATLTTAGRTDADLQLAGLAYAVAGRPADITPLIGRVVSPEAAGHLKRAQAGQLPLAAELSASGLPETSRALLLKLPTSYERNVLLARLLSARPTDTNLATAADLLAGAAAINPSGLEAHQLLAQVYSAQNHPADSAAQTLLANQIQNGRP